MINMKYKSALSSIAMAFLVSTTALADTPATSSWMESIYSSKSSTPLNEIIIPGTHDSGTYDITSSSDFEPDTPWFFLFAPGVVAAFAKSQAHDIGQQLDNGVRYIDLRLDWHDNDIWIVHSMYSDKLSNILDDVKSFAQSHSKEIIILDFNSLVDSGHYDELDVMLQSKIGSLLIDNSSYSADSSIGDLWNSGGNIIALMKKSAMADLNNDYWYRSDELESDWANSDNAVTVKSHVSNAISSRNMNKLTVAQTVLTPNDDTIIESLYNPFAPQSLESLNEPMVSDVPDWTIDWHCDGINPNIIMTDFYNTGDIVSTALRLNENTGGHMAGATEKDDQTGYAVVTGDFNHDGYDDVAIGAPYEDVNGDDDAGAVNVLYGSDKGLDICSSEMWHQDSTGIEGGTSSGDNFGYSLAAGDFNADGFDDLAIGVPKEDLDGDSNSGYVNVIYGSNNGLSSSNNQGWSQDSSGIAGGAETDDHFGFSLAAGDFDGDGYDDLAIGVPKEDVSSGGNNNDGYVNVIYGTVSGLTSSGNQGWNQDSSGIAGGAEKDDHFGWALAVGDFDRDGFDDLAVGVPKEDVGSGGNNNDGYVNVIYGASSGLSSSGDQGWHQNSSNIEGTAEKDDHFGWALAVGDFDGDGYDDLAIGAPMEDVNGDDDAGAVNIIFGASGGLSSSGDEIWHQDSSGMSNMSAEADDNYGYSLAVGDFDNDGFDDLAIGSPKEDLNGDSNAGMAVEIYGSSSGLNQSRYNIWHQDVTNISGGIEADDHFGFSVASGDFNGDGYDDLMIGVPKEDLSVGGNNNDGAVHVLLGTYPYGLTYYNEQFWHQ